MTLRKPAKGSATKARRARKRAADAILARNAAIVRERDGHRCRVCGSRDGVQVHHIRYRSRGGDHATGNLVCRVSSVSGRPEVFDALDVILGRVS